MTTADRAGADASASPDTTHPTRPCAPASLRMPRACVVNLGCRVNRVECDWMERALLAAGCELVEQDEADVVLVNTCAVTGEAQAKTRKAIRHLLGLPRHPRVLATGCAANLFPEELESLGDRVRVVTDKDAVVGAALDCPRAPEPAPETPSGGPDAAGAGQPSPDGESPVPAAQAIGLERLRRGIKVQDGCDNRCTYCIVWRARGASRSVDPAQIADQVRAVVSEGAREVVLTGINLGRYRYLDPSAPDGAAVGLGDLLRLVAQTAGPGVQIRASSIEPPEVTPDIVSAMAELRGQVCAHLHLPLQSGCDATLARMGRTYDTRAFAEVVGRARVALPGLSLSTDVIVGFPGETDEEFERSLAFCRQMRFSKMHVFRFSPRPDTPAATMAGQVPAGVAHRRSQRMRELAEQLRADDARSRVGTVERMLVERLDASGRAWGTTASYHRSVLECDGPSSAGTPTCGATTCELDACEPSTCEPTAPGTGLVRVRVVGYDERLRVLRVALA